MKAKGYRTVTHDTDLAESEIRATSSLGKYTIPFLISWKDNPKNLMTYAYDVEDNSIYKLDNGYATPFNNLLVHLLQRNCEVVFDGFVTKEEMEILKQLPKDFTHIIRDGSWKLVLCRYNSYMISNNGEVESQYVMEDFNMFGDMFKGILMGKAYEIDKLELLNIW